MAGLRGAAPALSAWRGHSGRRYVVGVHDLAEPDLDEVDEAVVIAVRRDDAGIAQAVSIAASGSSTNTMLVSTGARRRTPGTAASSRPSLEASAFARAAWRSHRSSST